MSEDRAAKSRAHFTLQPSEGVKSGQNLNPGPKAQDPGNLIGWGSWLDQEHEKSPMCLQKKHHLRDPRAHVRKNTDFPLPYKKVQQFKDFPSVKNKNLKKKH